ncbi:hypothetical protein ACE2AJ_14635 [Aquihabitans daechungensis]|uniref:hypothetical protein n=1 Tax=Aquihabitans daechungensis TaxID=1052257 RepID=UPI003BA07E7D
MGRLTITGTKGVPAMLRASGHRGLDAQAAVDAGAVHREKVEGIWAYAIDDGAVAIAREAMAKALHEVCRDWLLVPLKIAAGGARKRLNKVDVDFPVALAMVRELIRTREIGALPLLTDDYLPYYGLYSLEDQDEIDRYLATLREWAETGGEHAPDDLPSPRRPRTIEAWRERVLLHGEFLGLGSYEDGHYLTHEVRS